MRFLSLPLIGLLLLAGGCTSYEYDIAQPADLARHIGSAENRFTRDSIEYRLQTVDSRLVLLTYNQTDQPITLNGDKSSVVDEEGQSHPLRTISIPPKSFAKLILPPIRPHLERSGPSIGIGIGTMIGSGRRPYRPGFPDDFDTPQYFAVVGDDAYYWDWDKESNVRLNLVFEQGDHVLMHDFVIARKKKP